MLFNLKDRSDSRPLGGTSFHLELRPFQKGICVQKTNDEIIETVFLGSEAVENSAWFN